MNDGMNVSFQGATGMLGSTDLVKLLFQIIIAISFHKTNIILSSLILFFVVV